MESVRFVQFICGGVLTRKPSRYTALGDSYTATRVPVVCVVGTLKVYDVDAPTYIALELMNKTNCSNSLFTEKLLLQSRLATIPFSSNSGRFSCRYIGATVRTHTSTQHFL